MTLYSGRRRSESASGVGSVAGDVLVEIKLRYGIAYVLCRYERRFLSHRLPWSTSLSFNTLCQIEKCDSGDSKQRWVYKDASGDYVRISPRSNQGLCLERDGGKMRLKSCDSSEDRQLLKGLKKNGDKFEFVPKGKDGYVLSQAHDPKSEEEIELIKKSTARGDHTNYWVVYNPSTSGSSGGGGGGGGGNGPAYKFKGSDWCSPNNKCGLCEGDCDVSILPFCHQLLCASCEAPL